jgi:uncharacterized protein YndB with AHSA1/START domain
MVVDRIERQIFIRADIDHLWSLVSKAGFFIGDDLHFDSDATEGETVVVDAGAHGRFPVRVERLAPPRYAAYRCWASELSGAELTVASSTLVEFTLVEQDGGVMLQVTESGFATLPGSQEVRDARRDDNVAGWAVQLERLRRAAEGAEAP